MGILTSIFGRAAASEPPSGQLAKEDDFVDVTLPIADYRFAKDGSLRLVTRGKINGQIVGFALELEPTWKSQKDEQTPITVFWGKGHILSVGAESDAFLQLLSQEYGITNAKRKLASRVTITMLSFGVDPRTIKTTPVKMKVFFESSGEDNYGEAFINVDLVAKVLEFRDKDPEYHHGIVSSLSGGT
jgi:hypothetical protein